MAYFAGIDVSLRSCALCIVDVKGTVLLERELPCEIKRRGEVASDHFPFRCWSLYAVRSPAQHS